MSKTISGHYKLCHQWKRCGCLQRSETLVEERVTSGTASVATEQVSWVIGARLRRRNADRRHRCKAVI